MRAACLQPWIRWCLLVWLAAFGPARAASAPDAFPAVFEHLTTADGLPQSTVYVTLQDSQGFVWFGTEDGLVRYDGHRLFRYGYRREAADGLPGNFVQAIAEDAHHDLWIAVADGGLARWSRSTDRFTVFRHDATKMGSLASDVVVTLLIDDAGRVWAGTRDSGIDVLDPASGHIEHLRHDAAHANSLIDNRIKILARGASGAVWVGTDGGVDLLLPGSHSFVHCPSPLAERAGAPDTGVLALYVDAGETLWQGAPDGGLIRRDASGAITGRFRHDARSPGSLANDNVRAILQDSDGRLWVGTEAGLDMLDRASGQFTHYYHQNGDAGSLTDSYVMSLYQDASGLLWVGTRLGGVNRWNPRSWNFGSHRPAWLEGRQVTAFADATDDRIWVASAGGGLARFDSRTGQHEDIDLILQRPSVLGDSRVMSLELDAAGTLWIGTMADGVRSLSPEGQVSAWRAAPGSDRGLSVPGIMSLYAGRDGRLWIGTHGGGVNVLEPKTGKVAQLPFESGAAGAVSSRNVSGFA